MLHLKVFEKFVQPSIEIWNIRIDEPVTTATDLVIGLVCLYAFFQLRKMNYQSRVKNYFSYYFLFLGLGAITGGFLGHAFQYRLAEAWKLVSWVLTLGTVALIAGALIEIAKSLVKPVVAKVFSLINILVFVLALFFTLWTIAFSPVKFYLIFGMVGMVGSLCYLIYRKTESRGVLVLMGAVGIGLLSAIFFSFEWGLSPWFNHNDISHVILSFSAFGIFKGVALIMDASIISP